MDDTAGMYRRVTIVKVEADGVDRSVRTFLRRAAISADGPQSPFKAVSIEGFRYPNSAKRRDVITSGPHRGYGSAAGAITATFDSEYRALAFAQTARGNATRYGSLRSNVQVLWA